MSSSSDVQDMRVEDRISERKLLKLLLFGLSSAPKLRVKKVSSFDGRWMGGGENVPGRNKRSRRSRSTMQRTGWYEKQGVVKFFVFLLVLSSDASKQRLEKFIRYRRRQMFRINESRKCTQ